MTPRYTLVGRSMNLASNIEENTRINQLLQPFTLMTKFYHFVLSNLGGVCTSAVCSHVIRTRHFTEHGNVN